MKVLALDYGAARTGVAVSDATGTLARPVCVVERAATRRRPRRALAALVAEHEAELVVVGLPLTLRGERGSRRARPSRSSRRSAAVSRSRSRPRTSGSRPRSRSRRAAGRRRTRVAAAHLLQGWLERAAVRRGLALAGRGRVVAVGGVRGGGLGRGWRRRRPAEPTATAPPPLARLRIIFPEGFTSREMADRVAAVRRDRDREAEGHAAADAGRLPPRGRAGAARRRASART